MSDVSIYAMGIIPPDEKYHKMSKVYNSCIAAEIKIPDDVEEFFNYQPPSGKGTKVDIDKATSEDSYEMKKWIDVDLSKLPKNVDHIRFICDFDG